MQVMNFLLVVTLLSTAYAFAPMSVNIRKNKFRGTTTENNMKRNVFLAPQIIFIASCAGAVFAYVYTNLDAIMEVRLTDVWWETLNFETALIRPGSHS